MKTRRGSLLLPCLLTIAMVVSLFWGLSPMALAEGTGNEVFLNGKVASSGDGMTADTAVKTFAEAKELLARDGTIFITGEVKISGTETWSLDPDTYGTAKVMRAGNYGKYLVKIDNGTLILEDIIIDGNKTSITATRPLIYNDCGNLIMNSGAVLQNNRNGDTFKDLAGGAVQTLGGTVPGAHETEIISVFTMNGGAITGNEGGGGGGVNLWNRSKFVMNGGIISGNSSSGNGGGVSFYSNILTSFEMNGGMIANNTATDSGSAIHVRNSNSTVEISPKETVSISGSVSGKVLVTPVSGYDISSVVVDGSTLPAEADGGYSISSVETELTVTLADSGQGDPNTPPQLSADSTNNTVGQDISLSFVDNEAWRMVISSISVNGSTLDSSKYKIEDGTITIDKSVFTTAKNYTIVISADGYREATVIQAMVEDSDERVWDGSVDVSWYNTTDTEFYLSTPAQLAGLAALVNGHVDASVTPDMITGDFAETEDYWTGIDNFKDKTIYLTADLNMGGVYDGSTDTWSGPNWTPVGGQYCTDIDDPETLLSTSFNGTLDGQGQTLKNVYCNRYTPSSYDHCRSVGGVVGRLGCHDGDDPSLRADNPTVRNIAIDGYIYGRRSTGGIVGKIGKSNKGGIIENCANFATVKNTDSKGCGGIVGAGWNGGCIKNCYNAGDVSSTYKCPTGGISGSNEIDIHNCYNVGNIAAREDRYAMGIGTNNGGRPTVSNCYWLAGSAPGGGYFGGSTADVKEVTGEYMKSDEFLAELNGGGDAFVADTKGKGYPILAWQAGTQPQTPIALTAPVVTLSGNTISWETVANVIEYEVTITPETGEVVTIKVAETSLDLTTVEPVLAEGTYTITVSAKADAASGQYTDSTASNELTYQVGKADGKYTVQPTQDSAYEIGTYNGISTMTVKPDISGMKYFGVEITPIISHEGLETVVFTQWRDGTQFSINATRANFDTVQIAQAGFNVSPGDVIKACIVDELTNDINHNPILLQ